MGFSQGVSSVLPYQFALGQFHVNMSQAVLRIHLQGSQKTIEWKQFAQKFSNRILSHQKFLKRMEMNKTTAHLKLSLHF